MGWFAAGCCTAIAGYVFYRFALKSTTVNVSRSPPVRAQHESNVTAQTIQKPQPQPQPLPKLPSEDEPVTQIAIMTPCIENFDERVDENTSETTEAETVVETTKITPVPMPPPPPPLQSSRSGSPPRLKPPTFSKPAAPPPRPGNGVVRPPPSAASSLRIPPSKPLPNSSLAPTASIMPPGKQVSRKVILDPGHSPLDWAALTNNPRSQLRGKDVPPGENLLRVPPSLLKLQNGRKGRDAWTVYQGKVYNITPYVPFHPGGKGEILRGAGKDSVKLFMEVHPWVNWDGMLSECLVGILVGEDEAQPDGQPVTTTLDEMD